MSGIILIVDDNRAILAALTLLLERYFSKVITSDTPNRIDELISENNPDVILLDMNFSAKINTGNEGLYWLTRIKERRPDISIVVFTAYADIELAVEAIKRGATDFVVKPWNNDKLIETLNNAYNLHKAKKESRNGHTLNKESKEDSELIWGQSKAMIELKATIEKVAPTDANILITGENGTGKEMVAKEIHNKSLRKSSQMITVDMGAVTESLFESELFGHIKGSFTDARNDRIGKFEVANNGTLFLDEIGNLPFHLQSKLLTAIQSNRITKIGSNAPVKIDIRLICATNRNLPLMVKEEKFREDLLYRINTIHIMLPPLRERDEDIILLAETFLKRYANKYGKSINGFSSEAIRMMKDYRWPGNIRELQHTIEKGVILCDSTVLEDNFLFTFRHSSANTAIDSSMNSIAESTNSITYNHAEDMNAEIIHSCTIEEMEYKMIENAIKELGGNMTSVAHKLGITRQTLYNKIKKYGISI